MAKIIHQSKNITILFRMLSYLKSFKKDIIFLISCLLITALLNTVQPFMVKQITDYGLVEKNIYIVSKYAIIILILVAITQCLSIVQTKFYADMNTKYQYILFKTAFRKLLNFKLSYFTNKNYEEVINNITIDVNNVSKITDKSTFMIVSQLFQMISGIIGLLIINWKLTILVIIIMPIKYIIVKKLSKDRRKSVIEFLNRNREFYSWFGDTINGIKEIKLWLLHRIEIGRFIKQQKKILKANIKLAYIDNDNQLFETILFQIISCLLYIAGGIMIVRGDLTIGGLFAFLSYSSYVTGPISSIINLKYNYENIFPSAERFFDFLDIQEEGSGNLETQKPNRISICDSGTITYENVSFKYNEKPILINANIKINAGEKVAVIGENGAGKTTFLNLLLRLYEPASGAIYYNNQNIRTLKLKDYRELFSVVSQDPYLFNDTVKRNIDLKDRLSEDELIEVCKKSGADQFIHNLTDQYNSIIGRNGASLSGGERQKIAVARAFVNNTPIVVFDEATSNFDSLSDEYLNSIIFSEFSNKTVLVITHKTRILKYMDRIFSVKNGHFEEIAKEIIFPQKSV
jgi:ATP-binding cassette subfamily B protein